MENFLLKKNKILIVSAHPDDEILGCGGAINQIKNTNKIKIIFLTNGVSARLKNKKAINLRKKETLKLFRYLKLEKPTFYNMPDNQLDKVPLLKIIKIIEKEIDKFNPDIVFTHTENCLNIDHVTTYNAVVTACRPVKKKRIKALIAYEVPSSTEWKISKKKFIPNFYLNIEKNINDKIRYLKYYKSELKKYPHSRSVKGVKIYAQFRGMEAGLKFAEAYEIKKLILK
jgi:LmbE family N-acetylglucosaminyl deacetylase